MKILLANPRGFCAGVNMAIQCVEEALKIVGAPLYVYHEIVHNRHVVQRFIKQGVIFVDSIDDVPAKCTVVFLLVGHARHEEVVGTVGEAPDAITIVESTDDVERLPFTQQDKLAYLTQTTLSLDDANVIIDAIKKRYPQVKAPPSSDICYATTNRQQAVRQIATDAQLVLVVGSKNSSNSIRLTEISKNSGTMAYLVDDKSEIDHRWLDGVKTVLVTAGASAPEHLVQEILDDLLARYGGDIEEIDVIEEDEHFELPRSLRVLRGGGTNN